MTSNMEKNKGKKIPKWRKGRTIHKSNRYEMYTIPLELYIALKRFKEDNNMKSNEEIFHDALIQIKMEWEMDTNTIIKKKIEQCLVYNPPPKSEKHKRVGLRFKDSDMPFIKILITAEFPYVKDTTKLVNRVLSWYLRKEGYLAPFSTNNA